MVTAVGAHRPGVIAAISGVLVERSCNLSDAQMAVLQGHASMMLVVDCPEPVEAGALQAALEDGLVGLGHEIWVRPLPAAPEPGPRGRRWLVSVHGADRPGVVFEVSRLLADTGINVVDLESRLAGRVASLTMQVDVPAGGDGEEVARRLDHLGDQLGLSCSMRPLPDGP